MDASNNHIQDQPESKYHANLPHPVGTVLIERFRVLKILGKGSFGVVYQVNDEQTNQISALKVFKRKFVSWEAAMRNAEVKAMIGLKHQNVVVCHEVLRHEDCLYILFEILDMDLYRMMQMRRLNDDPFSHEEIRHIIKQIAQGLDYIHTHGFFHRDIKPENVLVQNKTTIKLGDFGLIKEIRYPTPFTEYVSTRWYRAPENVLGSRSYNYPVDVFALGCIMAELYTFKPLFPGSSEMDQFEKISRILGRPDNEDWPDARRLAERKLFSMPDYPKQPMIKFVPRASPEALNLLEWMLQYNPKKRPKPSQILQHEFLHPQTHTSQYKSTQDTTADSKNYKLLQSRVDSIVIGSSTIPVRPKQLNESPVQLSLTIRNQITDEATKSTTVKKPSNGFRNSVESTKLEPIEEKADKQSIISNSIQIEPRSQINQVKTEQFIKDTEPEQRKGDGAKHTLKNINMSPDLLNRTIGSPKFKNLANSQSRLFKEPLPHLSTIVQDQASREVRNASVLNTINSKISLERGLGNLNHSFLATNREWMPKIQGKQINKIQIANAITLQNQTMGKFFNKNPLPRQKPIESRNHQLVQISLSQMSHFPSNAILSPKVPQQHAPSIYNDQLKISLPEIMQQQQTKINQMKKQHEQRFQNRKYLGMSPVLDQSERQIIQLQDSVQRVNSSLNK